MVDNIGFEFEEIWGVEYVVYCGFELLVTFWVYNIGIELEVIWGVEILVYCGFELLVTF